MVKLTELPIEKGRIELEQLQYFLEHLGGKIELIATGEEIVEDVKDEYGKVVKSGGLNIHYKTRDNFELTWDMTKGKELDIPIIHKDGMGITQKYGKQGSTILTKHMEGLEYDDTAILQDAFHEYRLRQQRTGFSRLYPVKRVD